jgi:hypothetical protein
MHFSDELVGQTRDEQLFEKPRVNVCLEYLASGSGFPPSSNAGYKKYPPLVGPELKIQDGGSRLQGIDKGRIG